MMQRGSSGRNKAGTKKILFQLLVIMLCLVFLAFVDFIVLEKIYHPLSSQYGIPWDSFDAVLFGKHLPLIWWHLAFFPLAFFIFILAGVCFREWKVSLAGIILFATGWEDMFYYLIPCKGIPSELSWLDYSPLIGLSRIFTQTQHIIMEGLVISIIIGGIIALLILFSSKLRLTKRKK